MSATYTANCEGELILTDANGDSRRLTNYTPKLVEWQRVDDGFNITDRMIFVAYRKGKRELPVALTKEEIENGRFNAKFSPGCRIELGRGNKACVAEMMLMQAIFQEMSSKQGERVAEEKPTELFLNTLHELVMTKDAKLCEFDSDTPANYISPATVGFIDKSNGDVYLIKGKVYAAVCEQLARCGNVFPISATNLWKHLAEEHLSSVNKGRYDKKKQIPGVAGNWFIHIPSAVWGNAEREEVKE